MDSSRSWLQKLQPQDKDRVRPAARGGGGEDGEEEEAALSSATKQKVEAAKQYIENHYKAADEVTPGAQGETVAEFFEVNGLELEPEILPDIGSRLLLSGGKTKLA